MKHYQNPTTLGSRRRRKTWITNQLHDVLIIIFLLSGTNSIFGQCGGVERWAVKVGADPAAAQIDTQAAVITTIYDLVRLQRPDLPTDEFTRTAAEGAVRIVEGHLVKFKKEAGKTGDSDFHLVISDATLQYSSGGSGSQPSSHSVIAEIPDPDCVAGKHGQVASPSHFQAQLVKVREIFLKKYPVIKSGWNDAKGDPVRLTGVVFFDSPHGQAGRALNGIELHPLLNIEFISAATSTPVVIPLQNPGFEEGISGWSASNEVISNDPDQLTHSGSWKAWLGGYGESHTDQLSQPVTLSTTASTLSLTFFLHVNTEEEEQEAYDKLFVRVRDANGILLKRLKTFSNKDASDGFTLQSLDLTLYKNRAIIIEFEAREDYRLPTSFIIDDVEIKAVGI